MELSCTARDRSQARKSLKRSQSVTLETESREAREVSAARVYREQLFRKAQLGSGQAVVGFNFQKKRSREGGKRGISSTLGSVNERAPAQSPQSSLSVTEVSGGALSCRLCELSLSPLAPFPTAFFYNSLRNQNALSRCRNFVGIDFPCLTSASAGIDGSWRLADDGG